LPQGAGDPLTWTDFSFSKACPSLVGRIAQHGPHGGPVLRQNSVKWNCSRFRLKFREILEQLTKYSCLLPPPPDTDANSQVAAVNSDYYPRDQFNFFSRSRSGACRELCKFARSPGFKH
jgi:hypothetical protein